MKQTKLWLGMIAMLLCNLLPIHAESVTVRFDDWTSTNHGHGSTSSKTYTFTAAAIATLSFDWWVSSETNYDKLIVTLDGTTILEKSGSLSGTYNHAITQGEHTLVVKYTKDGSNSSGSDQACISNLTTTTTTTTIDGLAYSTTGNTACVIGAIDTAEVVIPSNVTINDTVYLVTSIGSSAFYNCSSLTSITLPEGVTSIENYAFDNCTALKKVIIEDGSSTLSLGYNGFSQGLFYDCPLEEVYLGRNLSYSSGSSYGYSPFYNKTKLTTLAIGDNVTSIGSYAFSGCSSLYKVINCSNLSLSKGSSNYGYVAYYAKVIYQGGELTTVDDYQFYTSDGIYSLVNYIGNDTEIVLPDSYNGENYKIGDCAFRGCSSLTAITLPEGVTSIGDYAFHGCSSLTAITLPEGVTSIGDYAFYGCSSLTAITLPEGVTSIGDYAFYGCSSLTTITIPESVTSIGNYAFDNCTALKKVIIEDGSTTLSLGYNGSSQGLFYDCPLVEVYLGRNLSYSSGSSYGYSPFYNKDALTHVTIGDEVTAISQYAFYGCDNIHSLTISSGVLSIGSNAFNTPEKVIWLTNTPPTGYTNANGSINYVANDQHSSLSNLKVYPYLSSMFEVDGVKYVPVSPSERTCHAIDCAYNSTAMVINVGETAIYKRVEMKVMEVMPYTFYGNDHIKEVNISHKGNIGDYAFYDCDGIKSLDISNVGYVGDEAFRGCGALETAIVANSPKEADSTTPQPVTFADWTSTNHSSSSASSETYTFTAAASATLSFDWWVSSESGYDKLKVTLDGTTILEKSGSLSGTYNHAITQGEHTLVVKYTKDGSNSSGSDQASVSNIVVSAGSGGTTGLDGAVCNSVFYDCVSLKSVTLGDKVTSLGNDAFRGCRSLQEIVIPNSVKSVGAYCFSSCSAMKSAVIGDGLTNIAQYTFQNCTGLTNVMVGDGVTTINNYAFTGCSALTNVTLGRSVATINNYAFQGCSSLPEITLPQAVTKVGDYVFAGCSKLADVMIADRTTALALGSNGSSPLFADCPLDSVYIGGKITYSTTSSYGYSPFYRNTSLRTVVITDREEQIYNNEFYGCTNLQNVTIGNGVKSIGNYAFSGCSSLEGFSFGSNMESIGDEAFSDCTALTSITSHAAAPPTCGTQALDDINKWNCVLRVPSGYAAAYQAAEQWKEFFFVEDVVEVTTYVLTYMVDGVVYHTETLAHKAPITAIAEPTKEGYTFSGWDEMPATMPAEDVTINGKFTVNKYLVTFKVDGEIVYSESLEYGASIVVPEAPEKEGHTFNGWGEVDTTVPPYDVTYEANYSVNSYQLTYVVDGETVQTESVAYGTAITLIDEPVKEGYTFSGWGEVPETMPAHDVTLNGTFTVNKYLVTFTVDGAVIASDSLEYGTAISVPTMPEREGYTFSGWSEVAETVPAHDVTYDASYTANIYKVYYFVGATLVHTAEVAYGEAIPEYIYEPTAEGDVFLGWVGESYETMPAHDVTYTANITNDVLQLTIDNSQSAIYDLMGRKVTDTEKLRGGIYIVNGRKVFIK